MNLHDLNEQKNPLSLSAEGKFNNTDIYENPNRMSDLSPTEKMNRFNYNSQKEREELNKKIESQFQAKEEDIKEEITAEDHLQMMDNLEMSGEKSKSSSQHNFTSSQTFGYDNSVTSYNLDFYDYVEEVKKVE